MVDYLPFNGKYVKTIVHTIPPSSNRSEFIRDHGVTNKKGRAQGLPAHRG